MAFAQDAHPDGQGAHDVRTGQQPLDAHLRGTLTGNHGVETGEAGDPSAARLDIDAVRAAAERVAGHVTRTPLLTSAELDARVGATVFVKAECLQRAGSFKARGAFSRLLALDADARARGVVAYSSGNHGAAVSLAGAELGIPVTVAVPTTVAPAKLDAIRSNGAELVYYDPDRDDRSAIAQQIAIERGLTLVAPYDDYLVMAGQGTLALEIFAEAGDLDMLVVPVSGGGLIAGVGVAAKALNPAVRVIGVEPADADDTRRSLAAGRRTPLSAPPQTIADGLRVQIPGELTFPINRETVDTVVTVTDDEIIEAMRLYESLLGVRAEPSGAVAFAALTGGGLADHGVRAETRVGVVLSGGNVDAARFAQLTGRPSGTEDVAAARPARPTGRPSGTEDVAAARPAGPADPSTASRNTAARPLAEPTGSDSTHTAQSRGAPR